MPSLISKRFVSTCMASCPTILKRDNAIICSTSASCVSTIALRATGEVASSFVSPLVYVKTVLEYEGELVDF